MKEDIFVVFVYVFEATPMAAHLFSISNFLSRILAAWPGTQVYLLFPSQNIATYTFLYLQVISKYKKALANGRIPRQHEPGGDT